MRRLLLLFVLLPTLSFAQQTELTKEDKALLDSLLQHDAFFSMLKDLKKGKSYFKAGMMAGNSYFSVRNKRLNASQEENKFVLTPSLGYYHKSGLAISGEAFLIDHNNRSAFYQYSGSVSWTAMKSRKVETTVSYTRFFRKKGYELITTPLENELYGKINLSKPWVQPGISAGYADGDYTTYHRVDTVLFGIRRTFMDTMRTSVSDLALSAYVQHYFEFYHLFHKDDGIGVTPQLILNAGISNFKIMHHNPFISRLQNRDPERFRNAGTLEDQGKLMLKSVALSVDAGYTLGRLGISPQLYLDYYLPETTELKLSAVFSLELSVTF